MFRFTFVKEGETPTRNNQTQYAVYDPRNASTWGGTDSSGGARWVRGGQSYAVVDTRNGESSPTMVGPFRPSRLGAACTAIALNARDLASRISSRPPEAASEFVSTPSTVPDYVGDTAFHGVRVDVIAPLPEPQPTVPRIV